MQAIFFFSERVFDYQSNDKELGIELQKNLFDLKNSKMLRKILKIEKNLRVHEN